MGFGTPPTVLEGDYSTYSLKWKHDFSGESWEAPKPTALQISESLDVLFLVDPWNYSLQKLKLSDGTLLDEFKILQDDYHSAARPSVLNKYSAVVIADAGVPKMKVYKNCSLLVTLNLNTLCGWTNVGQYYAIVFSVDGQYLFVSNTIEDEYALFEGS